MNNKILTEEGLMDEGAWDKIKQFAKGQQPNLRTAYLQNFNKSVPQAQPAQAPVPQAQPPVAQQPVPQQQPYKGPVPPVIPQAATQAAVPPAVPTQGMSLNTKAGTFGVNLTTGGAPAAVPAAAPAATPAVPPQAIPMANKNVNFDQYRKQQQAKKAQAAKAPKSVPAKPVTPPASSKSPERSETGALKLQEDFITKNQLKTLIKSVAAILKETK